MGILDRFKDPLDLFGNKATDQATAIQQQFSQLSLGLQRDFFDQLRDDQAPVRETRNLAIDRLQNNAPLPDDPNLGFQTSEGLRAIRNQAAARGKLNSGGRFRTEQDFVSGLNAQSTGNQLNRLLNIAGFQTTDLNQNNALTQSNLAGQTNSLLGLGDIRAGGIVAQNNNRNNLINTGLYFAGRGF